MPLLTETLDVLVTEAGKPIGIDRMTCEWPTLQEVKDELGIVDNADDAFLTRSIDVSIASIEAYVGRKLPLQVDSETFHITDCDKAYGYMSRLQLRRWPIAEVITCIDGTGNTVTHSIDEGGMLCGCFPQYSKIMVDYHGGVACDSGDFNIALDVFWSMVNYRYAQKNTVASSSDVKKKSIPGVYTIEYHSPTSTSSSSSATPANASYYKDSLTLLKTYYV